MRKTKQREVDEQWRFYLLHRECVRRNTDYQADYEKREEEDLYASGWGLISFIDPKERLPLENILTEKQPPDVGRPDQYSFDPYEIAAMYFLDQKNRLWSREDNPPLDSILVMTYFHKGKTETTFRHLENMRRPKGKIM